MEQALKTKNLSQVIHYIQLYHSLDFRSPQSPIESLPILATIAGLKVGEGGVSAAEHSKAIDLVLSYSPNLNSKPSPI